MYKVQVSNIKGVFSLPTLTKVDKGTLLTIPNLRYEDITSNYQHLKGVEIEDTNIKPELPAIWVFKGPSFELHIKWNSKVPELEADNQLTEDSQTYAKEQLEVKTNEAKLHRLPWDKVEDTVPVTFSSDSQEATKREVPLKKLNFNR